MLQITAELLKTIAPQMKINPQQLATYLHQHFLTYEINTLERISAFLAQAFKETAGFVFLHEAEWLAPDQRDAYYTRMLEGRRDLGNTEPGDGAKFHGRGILQLTGRYNYQSMGNKINKDLIQNPDLVSNDLSIACQISCVFWKERGLNALADANNFSEITRRISGGLATSDERLAIHAQIKNVMLSHSPASKPVSPLPSSASHPTTNSKTKDKLSEKILELEQELTMLNEQRLQLSADTLILDNDVNLLIRMMTDLNTMIDNLTTERDNLDTELRNLIAPSYNKFMQLKQLETELQEKSDSVEAYKRQQNYHQLTNEHNALVTQRQLLLKQAESLTDVQALLHVKAQLDDNRQRIHSLKTQIDPMNHYLEEMQTWADNQKLMIDHLANEIAVYNQNIPFAEMKAEISNKENAIQEAKDTFDLSFNIVTAKKSEIEINVAEFDLLEAKIDGLQIQIRELQDQLQQFNSAPTSMPGRDILSIDLPIELYSSDSNRLSSSVYTPFLLPYSLISETLHTLINTPVLSILDSNSVFSRAEPVIPETTSIQNFLLFAVILQACFGWSHRRGHAPEQHNLETEKTWVPIEYNRDSGTLLMALEENAEPMPRNSQSESGNARFTSLSGFWSHPAVSIDDHSEAVSQLQPY